VSPVETLLRELGKIASKRAVDSLNAALRWRVSRCTQLKRVSRPRRDHGSMDPANTAESLKGSRRGWIKNRCLARQGQRVTSRTGYAACFIVDLRGRCSRPASLRLRFDVWRCALNELVYLNTRYPED